jgi:hypothetical protein
MALPLVFNPQRPLVALKLTQANLSDTTAVPELTKDLVGKRFADKGEIGKQLAVQLRRRGLALMTRGRRNMQAWPISRRDQALLNGGNSAATIIAHIQEFSSLRLPKHRLVFNPFTHITAAIVASQIDPWLPKPVRPFMPLPNPVTRVNISPSCLEQITYQCMGQPQCRALQNRKGPHRSA